MGSKLIVSALLVGLAIAMFWVESSEALWCYNCYGAFGTTDCANSTREQDKVNCTTFCKTEFTVGDGFKRSCASDGCSTNLGALYTCYNCSTDLCNFQPNGAALCTAPAALVALLTVAILGLHSII